MTLSKLQQTLLEKLNDVRNRMETLLEDETVISLPKELSKIRNEFDVVLQSLEDGEFETPAENESEQSER